MERGQYRLRRVARQIVSSDACVAARRHGAGNDRGDPLQRRGPCGKKSCLDVRSSHDSETHGSSIYATDVIAEFSLFFAGTSCDYRRKNRSAGTENLPEAA